MESASQIYYTQGCQTGATSPRHLGRPHQTAGQPKTDTTQSPRKGPCASAADFQSVSEAVLRPESLLVRPRHFTRHSGITGTRSSYSMQSNCTLHSSDLRRFAKKFTIASRSFFAATRSEARAQRTLPGLLLANAVAVERRSLSLGLLSRREL